MQKKRAIVSSRMQSNQDFKPLQAVFVTSISPWVENSWLLKSFCVSHTGVYDKTQDLGGVKASG